MKQNNDGLQGQKNKSAEKGQAVQNKKTTNTAGTQEGAGKERTADPQPHEQKTPSAKRSK